MLALEISFDPVLPEDRRALYSSAVAGPETKTLVVYDEPFWRSDGFSGQSAEPKFGVRGDPRRHTVVGNVPASSRRSPSVRWRSVSVHWTTP